VRQEPSGLAQAVESAKSGLVVGSASVVMMPPGSVVWSRTAQLKMWIPVSESVTMPLGSAVWSKTVSSRPWTERRQLQIQKEELPG
jgi:hypothetical protein